MYFKLFQGLLPLSSLSHACRVREDQERDGHEEVGGHGGSGRRRMLEAATSTAIH